MVNSCFRFCGQNLKAQTHLSQTPFQVFFSQPLFSSHCFDTNRFPPEIQELCFQIIQPQLSQDPKPGIEENNCVGLQFLWKDKISFGRAPLHWWAESAQDTLLNHPLFNFLGFFFLSLLFTSKKACEDQTRRPLKVHFSLVL